LLGSIVVGSELLFIFDDKRFLRLQKSQQASKRHGAARSRACFAPYWFLLPAGYLFWGPRTGAPCGNLPHRTKKQGN
jgi:hypothetical protein